MNKSDFITKVATSSGQSKQLTADVLNATLAEIVKALKEGDSVEFIGFGKFERKFQKAREGKVPGTDKTYKTEDKFVPSFKVGKSFKEEVSKA